MISVSRVPRVPHSHEAKFRHKANPAVAFPQISAVGRSVAEARYDRRQSRAGRRAARAGSLPDADLAARARGARRGRRLGIVLGNNGARVAAGACRCKDGWRGPDCGALDLVDGGRPLWPPASRFGAASSWGASVVAHDGAHWIFVSEMAAGCGLATWRSNSMVVAAERRRPARPLRGGRGPSAALWT
ncbi:hypothetical protein SO694_00007353 [Aureococcus anophagefferens]|uniref:EGF-like domain-containing protein n=1 Tax=Aureococcus anophagefferens TaxID=44056 RepID=A0ABR1GAM1_AURAN